MPVVQITPFPLIPKQRISYTRPALRASLPPHYKVFLHRETNCAFEHQYVAKTVYTVIDDMSYEEACNKTTEAYLMGRSLLRVCPQGLAEVYCEKIRDNKVIATIEAVDTF